MSGDIAANPGVPGVIGVIGGAPNKFVPVPGTYLQNLMRKRYKCILMSKLVISGSKRCAEMLAKKEADKIVGRLLFYSLLWNAKIKPGSEKKNFRCARF